MNREGKKCFLYLRVSTEMQVDGYSLEAQKNCLKKFAEREELVIAGVYEDAGKSGKSIEGRPAFRRMLSDIESGAEIDYVMVYKLSRFGRNAADILNSLELLQTYDVNLICIEEGIDSSQTSGKLLISVLSAVSEIERENILEQTMNGRREKARQGKWNGGPAPYGYMIKDEILSINEEEAEIVRTIYDKYVNTRLGYSGIAKYFNLQGIKKTPRKESDIEEFSAHFIQLLIDNPVYCGKIAYGRRMREKVKGKKNEYRVFAKKDFSITEGQHEAIVSEEIWKKAHSKRINTGVKFASKSGQDRAYLLTGILKCPKCGSSMYANRIRWTKKDGTEKEIMYYSCSRNKMKRGGFCDYNANLKKTDIEPLVVEVIKQLIRDKEFAIGIKKRIGMNVDVSRIIKEIDNYELKLKEVKTNKTRLEEELDSLPLNIKYRERKICDMTARIDSMYDIITELEEKIEDAQYKKRAIEEKSLTLENIYRILEHFSEFYDIMNDEERKELLLELIKEVHIYPEGESEYPLKSIKFNFPVLQDGKEVEEIFLNKQLNVETLVVLSHKKPDSHLEVKIDFDNTALDKTAIAERAETRKPQEKTTYKNM